MEQNGGAPGVDGVTTKQLRDHLKAHWPRIREELLTETYQPAPVRRVEIPKPSGGVRLLGIPTVQDRLIQQALLQVLTPLFDPRFSTQSHGFRPGRRAQDAVRQVRQYVRDGHEWVVDIDLEKFFDRVNHDRLMARIARRVEDRRVLRLIRRYLESGVLVEGVVVQTEEGTPQGGPLSPLLANILRDDLDKELERRGHKFARHADDCNIYVRTQRAGERVLASVRTYLQKALGLRVNEAKSAVDRPWRRKFLGFSLTAGAEPRIRLAPQTIQRVKQKLRDLTSRSNGKSMQSRIQAISTYLGGWVAYFALAETPSPLQNLDKWLRRRLRMCQWKQWKRPYTRWRELRKLGLSEREAWEAAGSRKGYWRLAGSPPVQKALDNAYWRARGLLSLVARYHELRKTG